MTSEQQRLRDKKRWAAYRARHPERIKATQKASWERNKHKYLAKKKATRQRRYELKKDEILAKSALYYSSHREYLKEKQRSYRLSHLEQERRRCREWHAAHKDDPGYKLGHCERGRVNYEKKKSQIVKRHKEWRKRNPGYFAAMNHRRRLVENASKNLKAIKAWMKGVKAKPTAICYYCRETVPTKKIHFDHIVSIASGGIHDISNLCVACATCNLRKQDKTISAWVRIGQQILSL
jgi:5-methylcytosine-specific restriction endonuclease McrA